MGSDNQDAHLEEEFLMNVTLEPEGEKSVPCMEISNEDYELIQRPQRKALIIKVIGRNISYWLLEQKIRDLWKLNQDFELVDLESGYYLAHFQSAEDYHHVLNGVPWMILGHFFTVAKLRPNFLQSKDEITTTLDWIQFQEIPIKFFHHKVLMHMGNLVGKAIKMDATIMMAFRGKFASVYVEIDL